MSTDNSKERLYQPMWEQLDLLEEAERVERHIEMAREMISEKDDGEDTACRICFTRVLDFEGMQAADPCDYEGILLGINEGELPSFTIGSLKACLTEWDGTAEGVQSMLLSEADVAIVPVREVDHFMGGTATPDTWDFWDKHE